MSEFNFKSQICTSRVQSERLLALGLKKATADMWYPHFARTCPIPLVDETLASDDIPAWSLHRLLCIVNLYTAILRRKIKTCHKSFEEKDNIYDNLIDCIEWLIKEGYFNKEYLV